MSRTQTIPVKEKTSEQFRKNGNDIQISDRVAFNHITVLLGIVTILAVLIYTTTWLTLSAWH
jgi:hypothetical protein